MMKRNTIVFILLTAIIIVILFYSFSGGESREEYIARIATIRAEKDVFFKYNSESPFANDSENFKGLNYYQPDPDYKVNARLSLSDKKEIITLSTNDSLTKAYKTFGIAEFELGGKTNHLLILEMYEPLDGKLFLAFADQTSAEDTYGAGRYLDVEYSGDNFLTLDFNLAYNPYCAYAEGYSCPFPPPDNLLETPIKAGEKIY